MLGSWLGESGHFISHLTSTRSRSRAFPPSPFCIPLSPSQTVTGPCCGYSWLCLELHTSEIYHTGERIFSFKTYHFPLARCQLGSAYVCHIIYRLKARCVLGEAKLSQPRRFVTRSGATSFKLAEPALPSLPHTAQPTATLSG